MNCNGTEKHILDCVTDDSTSVCTSATTTANVVCPGKGGIIIIHSIYYFHCLFMPDN